MAQTSGSSSWADLGVAALGGVLSYEAGQANNVPSSTSNLTQPDIASIYYGQHPTQPAVGYNPSTPAPSAGMSTTEMLLIGGLVLAGVAAFFFLRR